MIPMTCRMTRHLPLYSNLPTGTCLPVGYHGSLCMVSLPHQTLFGDDFVEFEAEAGCRGR